MIDLSKLTYENIVKCLAELGTEFVNSYFIKDDLTYIVSEIKMDYYKHEPMKIIVIFEVESHSEIKYVIQKDSYNKNCLHTV